jgi:hypothetical protein
MINLNDNNISMKNKIIYKSDEFILEYLSVEYCISKQIYNNGLLHCEEGPAESWYSVLFESANSVEIVNNFLEGKLNKITKKMYYIDGKLHREDGLAVIEGHKNLYYYKGVLIEESLYPLVKKLLKSYNIK